MINADVLQELKTNTDILKLFRQYGFEPKKNGKGYKVNCPFHADTEPSLSINPNKNLWQCFGCGAAGDVISFVQKIEGIEFIEAVEKLAKLEGISTTTLQLKEKELKNKDHATKTKIKEKSSSSQLTPHRSRITDHDLLKKVAAYYHRTFIDNPEGRDYLIKRGITNEKLYSDHQIGYADGSLLNILNDNEIQILVDIGVLLDNKRERFINCVVFPLFDYDNIVSFYGRHIYIEIGGHFYLPGEKKGLFNQYNIMMDVIITESIIDALSFLQRGIKNVLPIYGTNGFTDDHNIFLNRLETPEIIIALDGDEQGQKAAIALKKLLHKELIFPFDCFSILFPDNQDANEFFKANDAKEFQKLVDFRPLSADFQIKRIDTKSGQLRVTLRIDHPSYKEKFLLDTYNLYSQKQRKQLIEDVIKLTSVRESVIKTKVSQLIATAEKMASNQHSETTEQPSSIHEISEDDKAEAITYLQNPALLDLITTDYETIGYTGEEINKKLAYLVMTSRKMKNTLSLIIMSNSAAGKSALQKATFDLCPPEDCKHFTRLTQQSLYYLGEDSIKNKFISIEEEEGSSEAGYSLKTLLSAKVLHVASTTQDPLTGRKKADEYKTEGPVAVIVSTTSPEVEPELASRTLIITIDESKDQTKRIHQRQRNARTLKGKQIQCAKEKIIKLHHNLQRVLDNKIEVVNNYADQLTFPTDRLKHRRGQEHYLDLIDSIAFLRQFQKELKNNQYLEKYIEVDKDDIKLANEVFISVMGWTISELKPPAKEVLKTITTMCKEKSGPVFQRRELREYGKYSNAHLHRHLKILEELEYIQTLSGSNGSKYTYELIYDGGNDDNEKILVGLKNVEELSV
ncbi:MAG TPA: hypothetical protein DF296_10750 [Candidatus Margulisbacteria bacterium]|nr:hypothetical protein [Candidatus Margulisiibacteriota bacterium]